MDRPAGQKPVDRRKEEYGYTHHQEMGSWTFGQNQRMCPEIETKQRKREKLLKVSEGEKKCLLPSLPGKPRTWGPFLQTQPEWKGKGGLASPMPFAIWHLSSRTLSCPSPSLLTSYVASWLGSGSCRGPRAVLSSSVKVSSFPASASIRFSRAWWELLSPSCKSHRIMCIWVERGWEVLALGTPSLPRGVRRRTSTLTPYRPSTIMMTVLSNKAPFMDLLSHPSYLARCFSCTKSEKPGGVRILLITL